MSTIFYKTLDGYRLIDTQIGDTLQDIAARELNDATQWSGLISINRLIYPYIMDDPALVKPGVILTGSQLFVPAPVPAIESTVDPAEVFLIDAALDGDGLLQPGPDGDLALVSGTDNFKQAIQGRIDTYQGVLKFHLDYGSLIRQLQGAVTGPNSELLAAKYAESAVLPDPRVQDVQSTEVTVTGDRTDVLMVINPVISRPLPISTTLTS